MLQTRLNHIRGALKPDDVCRLKRRGDSTRRKGSSAEHEKDQETRRNQLKEIDRLANELADIKISIKLTHEEYKTSVIGIHQLEQETLHIKPQIKANIQKQLDYYLALLAQGNDTRNIGLTWILRAIWYLEQKQTTHFVWPRFLDEDSKQCLMQVQYFP